MHAQDAPKGGVSRRLIALDYDATMEAIGEVLAHSPGHKVVLEANRLVRRFLVQRRVSSLLCAAQVKRHKVAVEYYEPGGERGTIAALAGDNLRKLLLREDVKLYDPRTKRVDQPFTEGDCAGEGICGTCLVAVEAGAETLSAMDATEKVITKGRPATWRAACRCIVGAENQDARLKIRLRPQSAGGAQDDAAGGEPKTLAAAGEDPLASAPEVGV
mmetsp:Transcript_15527/g.62515  ORF Transcript_15527/g.62515 Transcript_15527/m.62515 type:complete len:216 (-) Transcript_15527:257-904(-)